MTDPAVKRHLKMVRKQLYKNLIKAYKGWFYWHRLMKKYKKQGIANTAVILLPTTDRECNYLALRYVEQMLAGQEFQKALILTHSEAVRKTANLFSNKILGVEWCPRKKVEELMQYYCLYNFDKRFIVASLDEPYGRNGSVLIGKRGTTAEEIFVIGVYRVYPYEQLSAPDYNGDDREIMEFLYPETV